MDKVIEELKRQFYFEIQSEMIYIAISGFYCDRCRGMAHFFIVQAHEERIHAMKFYNYLANKGYKVGLNSIEIPELNLMNLVDGFAEGLKHEKFITSRIDMLMKLAVEMKDEELIKFLEWFVKEQQEEEESFEGLIKKFEEDLSVDQINNELSKRELDYKVD